ncbi:hypothetical protein TDB9533_04257 [Thalassocella blandensis]|nr:hypothetical protein TDB9533_04257 [Thalassocella blandensis]
MDKLIKKVSTLLLFFVVIFGAKDIYADVVKQFAGRTVTFSNINLNETGLNVITAAPGAQIDLDLDWSSSYTTDYCPGCIQQFYIGVKDVGISCLYSGGTSYDVNGQGSLSFTAPSEPGVYAVQASFSLQYSCTQTASGVSNSVAGAVAYIHVDDNSDSVTRTFAGREVTFSDISLNNTGKDFVSVAPGAPVSLNLGWASQYVTDYCPGCVQQFYIGVKDMDIDCIYSGNTASNRSGSVSLDFMAPTEPGVYVVQSASSLQYSCTRTQDTMSDVGTGIIGSFEVVAD